MESQVKESVPEDQKEEEEKYEDKFLHVYSEKEWENIEGFGKDQISQQLINHLKTKMKMPRPAQVQEIVIEEWLLEEATKFIMVEVMNGYGKTLSFVIPSILSCSLGEKPFIKRINGETNEQKTILTPNVIIISDTNTLMSQHLEVCLSAIPDSMKTKITVDLLNIYAPKYANIICCTPHMLEKAFLEENLIDFSQTKLVVFDQIQSIYQQFHDKFKYLFQLFNESKQQIRVIGASATMNDTIEAYFESFQWNDENKMEKLTISEAKMDGVTQYYYNFIKKHDFQYDLAQLDGEKIKFEDVNEVLFSIIYYINYSNTERVGEQKNQILIFFNQKDDLIRSFEQFQNIQIPEWIQSTGSNLIEKDLNPVWFSNDLRTSKRIKLIEGIQNGDFQVVFTTDLLSRGIDIRTVGFVINVGCPTYYQTEQSEKSSLDINTYQHRVARTGRFDSKGVSLTIFLYDRDQNIVKKLQSKFEIQKLEDLEIIDQNISQAINHNLKFSR